MSSAAKLPGMDVQIHAWQRYLDAKQKSERTVAFEDGRAAAEAWVRFLNVYLPENERLPERKRSGGNVALFPIHNTSTVRPRSRS